MAGNNDLVPRGKAKNDSPAEAFGMDLLRGNIKTLYFKYLSAAFGSALISSIYGIVDMAMVRA